MIRHLHFDYAHRSDDYRPRRWHRAAAAEAATLIHDRTMDSVPGRSRLRVFRRSAESAAADAWLAGCPHRQPGAATAGERSQARCRPGFAHPPKLPPPASFAHTATLVGAD